MKDPERSRRIKTIERRIKPLVQLLNQKGIKTIGSCQGHFGYDEPKVVTERAYVEFISSKAEFLKIQEIILGSLGRRRKSWLRFENKGKEDSGLITGTLYIGSPKDRSLPKQRGAIDRLIKKITSVIQKKYFLI